MQVLDEAYFNFVNSINSDQTRQVYEYTLSQFLKHYQMNLGSFLKLSQQDISNYIIYYLVNKKISRQYKTVKFSAIRHPCEMINYFCNKIARNESHKVKRVFQRFFLQKIDEHREKMLNYI